MNINQGSDMGYSTYTQSEHMVSRVEEKFGFNA
jgi:hypothetical protein